MSIVIEDREFDPALKQLIADFIDERYEDPDAFVDSETFGEFDAFSGSFSSVPFEAPYFETPPDSGSYSAGSPAAAFRSAPRAAMPPDKTVEFEPICLESAVLEESKDFEEIAPLDGSLQDWLDGVDEPFSTTLLMLIDSKGLTDVDVYKRANMSRQLFSRIRSDEMYRPAKKTVLALGIAMELSLDELRDLLQRAGFALSRSSKRDLIVEYFVTNGVYDLFTINEALYEFDQPLI